MSQPRPPDRPSDDDIDARFAAIVAGWDDEADAFGDSQTPPAATPDPAMPDPAMPDPAMPDPAPPDPAPPEPRRPVFDVAPTGWRIHVSPEDEADEQFEAPDPPLPRGDGRFWGSIIGLVFGPVLFIGWVLTGPHSTNLPLLLAGLGTAAGFVALISQLPQQRDEDDDGARV